MTGRRVLIIPLILIIIILSYITLVSLVRHWTNDQYNFEIQKRYPVSSEDYTKMEPEPTEIIIQPKKPLPADKKKTTRSTTFLQEKTDDDSLDYDPEINTK